MTLNNTLWYNFKKHQGGCGSSPVVTSITDQSSGASLYDQRLGSWHFYQAMGQPAQGKFVYYNSICYEYMGTSQDSSAGGIDFLAQKPAPALTNANHFDSCAGCLSHGASLQTYHAFEMCNNPGVIAIGLENTSTISVQSNQNVYTGLGSPALDKTATYNGICFVYKGMYTVGDAALTGSPLIFNVNTTPYLTPHVHNDNCAACQGTGGTIFHTWKQCGGTETINLLGLGHTNTTANNVTFYNSIGLTVNTGDIVNFDLNKDSNSMCWEYMGTNTLPEAGMQNISVATGSTQVYSDCTTCLNPGISGCTDILATNYNPSATMDDGSCIYTTGCTDPTATNYNPLATVDDGSCYTCVYGCMDATAINYNSAATCDDSSCRYSVGGGAGTCDINFSEICATDGTSTVTVDLSAGAGINNLTTKLQGSVVDGQSCGPATDVIITGVTEGQVINVSGECSYEKEDYDAASAVPQPGWAAAECGQVTVSSNTKVYAFYDGTSLGADAAKDAYKALMGWLKGVANFTVDTTPGSPTENVFHTAVAGERWLDWGSSVLTGKFNNDNVTQQYSINGAALSDLSHCTGGSDCAKKKVGNAYVDAIYESPGTNSKAIAQLNWAYNTATASANGYTWNVDEFYDTAEGTLIGQPMFLHGQAGNNPGQTWRGFPPQASNTDDVLVVIFADESMWSYHVGNQNRFTDPTNPYTHSTGGNSFANIDPQQPTLQYKADYNKFKALYAAHGGQYRAFLYPSRPESISSGGGHKMFPLHALAAIDSGNNVPADGMWQAGTSPTNAYSTIDIIETENPYWTGLSPTYGGLDQSGWGVNVAGASFNATTFQNDLEVFLGLNAQTCDGSQCTVIQVLDENAAPVSNYPITVNGNSIGSTDASGQISTTITTAGSVTINGCYTFTATGNCLQSLITINTISKNYTSNLNCITGCTDPLSWNYNPLAGIDDGSCMYPLTEEAQLSRCEQVKLDVECQFATDVFNLYKYERYGLDKGCLYNFDGHASKKYSMDWDDKLLPDFGTESYTKTLHTKGATPKPLWVDAACGGEPCDGSECIYFYVKDKNDKPVEDYEIVLDGIVIGKTDENGELRHSIPNAAEDTEHKVNFCHCFTTTGGCNSQRIKITVEGIEECNTCGLESVACTCIPLETIAGDIALEVLGCTDPTATNYNALANCDDGSCIESIVGCMDPTSLNYNPCANVACNGCCCDTAGCMDSTADNYNAAACLDDESCLYTGCMDPDASNYNPQANVACSGCCTYPGCTDPNSINYDPQANVDDGSCIPIVNGCTDPNALNYNASANVDDGSCVYCVYGCTDSNATNFDALATCDDGSCIAPVPGCTDPAALNYNPLANVDDGSCTYAPPAAPVFQQYVNATTCGAPSVAPLFTGSVGDSYTYDGHYCDADHAYSDITITQEYSTDNGTTWTNGMPAGFTFSKDLAQGAVANNMFKVHTSSVPAGSLIIKLTATDPGGLSATHQFPVSAAYDILQNMQFQVQYTGSALSAGNSAVPVQTSGPDLGVYNGTSGMTSGNDLSGNKLWNRTNIPTWAVDPPGGTNNAANISADSGTYASLSNATFTLFMNRSFGVVEIGAGIESMTSGGVGVAVGQTIIFNASTLDAAFPGSAPFTGNLEFTIIEEDISYAPNSSVSIPLVGLSSGGHGCHDGGFRLQASVVNTAGNTIYRKSRKVNTGNSMMNKENNYARFSNENWQTPATYGNSQWTRHNPSAISLHTSDIDMTDAGLIGDNQYTTGLHNTRAYHIAGASYTASGRGTGTFKLTDSIINDLASNSVDGVITMKLVGDTFVNLGGSGAFATVASVDANGGITSLNNLTATGSGYGSESGADTQYYVKSSSGGSGAFVKADATGGSLNATLGSIEIAGTGYTVGEQIEIDGDNSWAAHAHGDACEMRVFREDPSNPGQHIEVGINPSTGKALRAGDGSAVQIDLFNNTVTIV